MPNAGHTQDRDTLEVVLKRKSDLAVASSVYIVRGEAPILRLQSLLVGFCGHLQCSPGTLLDLPYFLQKPGFLKRVPYLFLVARRSGVPVSTLVPHDLVGAVLLFEYRIWRFGIQAYATNDRSGNGSLLSMPGDRARVAALVCGVLMGHGARVAMMSFAGADASEIQQEPVFQEISRRSQRIRWAVRHRQMPAYLQLHATLDQTLAGLGHKTRSNMRYYRRRAERELGCTTIFPVEATPDELVQFNKACMYPMPEATVRWRLHVMQSLHDPFLMGLKSCDGQWLSILAGRRYGETSEILWQMNRAGYPAQSLGTVMRSYCIEQEIARGSTRLQVEGGTFHSMANSFVQEQIVDLVLVRTVPLRALGRLVTHVIPADNNLAEMLRSEDLRWNESRSSH